MWNYLRAVITLCIASASQTSSIVNRNESLRNYCEKLVLEVYEERPFDTVVMVHHPTSGRDETLQGLHEVFRIPKIIITSFDKRLEYKSLFNSEIFTIVLMVGERQINLLRIVADTLDYIRQTRILILSKDIENMQRFRKNLLANLKEYKMTNVLMQSMDHEGELRMLKPYAEYHWLEVRDISSPLKYYPQHWKNLHKRTLLTLSDLTLPRAILFQDPHTGHQRLNGYLPRLIQLFAEIFNASLKMTQPKNANEPIHYTLINNMVDENLLDIPMTMDTGSERKWLNMSDTFEIGQGLVMVPCAQPLKNRELYGVLLNGKFFGSLALCLVIFSSVHTLCDLVYGNYIKISDMIINERVLPGILGQTFNARKMSFYGLKLLYILLFFTAINLNAQFSANMNTLFTQPSYHREIHTKEDLKQSPLKILLHITEAPFIKPHIEDIEDSFHVSYNSTFFFENRQNFNTSYGYYTSSTMWQLLQRKQKYLSQKIFCSPKDFMIFSLLPWAFRLQYNSPYKEALNYLIHRVHDLGLIRAWHSSTFSDLLKLNLISVPNQYPQGNAKILTVNDLYWIWITVLIVANIKTIRKKINYLSLITMSDYSP
ncbi:uncharacterized protein LOC142224459 [Haematobia irritans]|uniref:uncharacterized protein LOC142224459 n=1 Tax=Haematobia irritans TaxID=7368 RepID=UPI003F4F962C